MLRLRKFQLLAVTLILFGLASTPAAAQSDEVPGDEVPGECGSVEVGSSTFTGEVVGTDGRRVIFRVDGDDVAVRVEGERNRLKNGQNYEVTAYDLVKFDAPVAYLDAENCIGPDTTIRHADGSAINTSANWLSIIWWTVVIPIAGIGIIIVGLSAARRRAVGRRDELPDDDLGPWDIADADG